MSDPIDLISEIRPSRALDAAIHTRFFGEVLSLKSGYFIDDGLPVPAYSTSVDAAITLSKSLLPGWRWSVSSSHRADDIEIKPDLEDPDYGDAHQDAPQLSLSLHPSGHPALGMVACVLALMDGLNEDRAPFKDARELRELAPLAATPRSIKRHPGAPLIKAADNEAFGKILERSQ